MLPLQAPLLGGRRDALEPKTRQLFCDKPGRRCKLVKLTRQPTARFLSDKEFLERVGLPVTGDARTAWLVDVLRVTDPDATKANALDNDLQADADGVLRA